MSKEDIIGPSTGGGGLVVAGMTIAELVPWALGVILVILSIAAQIYAIKSKSAERAKHDEERKLAELQRAELEE